MFRQMRVLTVFGVWALVLTAGISLACGGAWVQRHSQRQAVKPAAADAIPTAAAAGPVTASLASALLPAATYPDHPGVVASVFDAGEAATASNAFIPNDVSAWDAHWQQHAVAENPYFVALPYGDYLNNGQPNPNNVRVPWYQPFALGQSILKNRWVAVTGAKAGQVVTVYGQWEDVGPSNFNSIDTLQDPDYVFGPVGRNVAQPITIKPKNTFGLKAGIDLSPAIAKAFGFNGEGVVSWRFVEAADVPNGPWKQIVTISAPDWSL